MADSTRRSILERLSQEDATAGELASPFRISAPAISKHLKTLEQADLVNRIREGKTHRFQLRPESLNQAEAKLRTLAQFWTRRLDNLTEFLENKS